MNILILAGGHSNERKVSLRSAENVRAAIDPQLHNITVLDPADTSFDLSAAASNIDLVLPILHGAGGEDGSIQKQLEELAVPFLGASSGVSILTFNKAHLRQRYEEMGIQVARGEVVDATSFDQSDLSHHPYVLKPIEGGSSIDTFIVHDHSQSPPRLKETLSQYGTMLLEELIEGQEITVGVLANEALPVIAITPPAGQDFDFTNKYNGATAEIVDPDFIDDDLKQLAQSLALRIHNELGIRHLSRTDMIIAPTGNMYVLETNTMPGLTEQSLFPKAAAAAGYNMTDLVKKFIDLAILPIM